MSDSIIVPTSSDIIADNTGDMVPLSSLEGKDLTAAVRQWARDNGIAVGDRGVIAPEITVKAVKADPMVPAPAVKVKRAPAAPKVPNIYDIHTVEGDIWTVEGGRGKCTLDRLAERAGVSVDDIDYVTRAGAVVDVPRRATGPVAEPWTVELTSGETLEYRPRSRGRMSVGKCADELGIKPTAIKSVSRGDTVYRVATVVAFTTD